MTMPDFIKRIFGSHDEPEMPAMEEFERMAMEADMPWISEAAYVDFANFPDAQGCFNGEPAPAEQAQHA